LATVANFCVTQYITHSDNLPSYSTDNSSLEGELLYLYTTMNK